MPKLGIRVCSPVLKKPTWAQAIRSELIQISTQKKRRWAVIGCSLQFAPCHSPGSQLPLETSVFFMSFPKISQKELWEVGDFSPSKTEKQRVEQIPGFRSYLGNLYPSSPSKAYQMRRLRPRDAVAGSRSQKSREKQWWTMPRLGLLTAAQSRLHQSKACLQAPLTTS